MRKLTGYAVMVPQVDEIGGEMYRHYVVAYTGKTLTAAVEWAQKKWGTEALDGTYIIDRRDGCRYDIFCRWPEIL